MINHICKQCKKHYKSYSSRQKYCSRKCYAINQIGDKNAFYGKRHSLETREIISKVQIGKKLSKEHKQKIGKSLKGKYLGKNTSGWKGGRCIDVFKYILIYQPNHPYCNKKKYVLEHRLVAESIMGRYLKPKEVIHHIDKNTQNNNPSNLYFFPSNSKHIRYHLLFRTKVCREITKSNLISQRSYLSFY